MKKQALFNWSGGKDSALALGEIMKSPDFRVQYLLTSIGKNTRRVSMHGVREELIVQQSKEIGLKLKFMDLPENPDMESYESTLFHFMNKAKNSGINFSIFGDIFLEDLKKYRELQLAKVDFKAVFPLWQRNTNDLIREFIDKGYKSIITAVDDSKLSKDFAGQEIDEYFLKHLPQNVDACGENGEFHSFVFDAPYYKNPINYSKGEIVHKTYEVKDKNISHGFWFCDLIAQ